jgi:preprotein translocase subunit SecE
MANKKNLPAKKNSKKPVKKAGKKRVNVLKRIGKFFKDVITELKKVTWPTRKNLISYTIAVLVFVAIMMAVVYGIDSGVAALMQAVFG